MHFSRIKSNREIKKPASGHGCSKAGQDDGYGFDLQGGWTHYSPVCWLTIEQAARPDFYRLSIGLVLS